MQFPTTAVVLTVLSTITPILAQDPVVVARANEKRQGFLSIVNSATSLAGSVASSAASIGASEVSRASTIVASVTSEVGSVVATVTSDVGSVVGTVTSDVGSIVSSATDVASSVVSSALSVASTADASATQKASSIVSSALSVASTAAHPTSGTSTNSGTTTTTSPAGSNAGSGLFVPGLGVVGGALFALVGMLNPALDWTQGASSVIGLPEKTHHQPQTSDQTHSKSVPARIKLRSHPRQGSTNSPHDPPPTSQEALPTPSSDSKGRHRLPNLRSQAGLSGGGKSIAPPQHQLRDHEEFELADYQVIQKERASQQRYLQRQAKRAEKIRRLDEADEMKFSHSIQFNAVPDWSSHYIAYSNLKKLIYQLEKTIHRPVPDDPERSPLIPAADDPDLIFQRALDVELEKISSFYQLKELEIYGEVSELLRDEESYEAENIEQLDGQDNGRPNTSGRMSDRPRTGSIFRSIMKPRRPSTVSRSIDEGIEDSEDDDDDESTALTKPSRPTAGRSKSTPFESRAIEDMRASTEFSKSVRRNSTNYEDYANEAFTALYSSGITLKKRTISLYVQLCELKSFIQLNKTGFTKVLKKYDKILDRSLKSKYVEKYVIPSYPFCPDTMKHVEENINKMEQTYADVVTQGDVSVAKKELRLHLREHVVWERNTVWREMIGIERKAQAANMGLGRTLLGPDNNPANARLQGDDDVNEMKEVSTPVGRFRAPAWLFSSTLLTLITIIAIFFVLLNVKIFKDVAQQNCLAMLVFVSLLWATEVIPLFVTSLLIPFLCVVLRVVRSDEKPHRRLDAEAATKYIFAAMWTPVIMLLLGGFTVAAALSKYDIAKRIATFVLSKAGTRPQTVLVTNMFVAAFASMWISNVAAPVLCFSIIQPMLRNLPSDSQMSKALILGIALASNIGGMLSPIASPQNIVALQIMNPPPTWGTWFFIAIPVGIISILLIWVILLVSFRPSRGTTIVPIRPVRDPFTGVQWFISLVTLGTIVLWCVSHQLEWLFGDMGIVAIIPLILFFGTGILTKEDFNNFLWTIIILAAGGLSLGKAVNSSGLLHTIANKITEDVAELSLYGVLVVFACLILVVATFISHTVAALIILPLVYSVGLGMEEPHPNLLVMGSAMMCSAAMGLPTSGFPNMTAIMMEDSQTGQRYLQVKHFISRGIPSSIVTLFVVITVGYGLMFLSGM